MQYVILGLLLAGPLSMYDVHKNFSAGISLFYSASMGSIQRALAQASAAGRVTMTDAAGSRRGKKLYAITPVGREAWRQWMLAPIESSDPQQTVLAKVFLLGKLEDPAERTVALQVMIERIRDDLERLRETGSAVDGAEVPADRRLEFGYQRATLDYGIRSHVLALEWLEELAHG